MRHIFLLTILLLSTTSKGQTILGEWETYSDKTQKKIAVIEIYQTDDIYFAKITEYLGKNKNEICENCTGDKKDQPLVGLVVIENLKKDGKEFNGGSILNPESGELYKCYLELIHDDKLKVRGFLGFSIFGRTQYWYRKV